MRRLAFVAVNQWLHKTNVKSRPHWPIKKASGADITFAEIARYDGREANNQTASADFLGEQS